jgi:hypothetical protein
MRAWSKQGFLNDSSSEDSGWYKFAIKPRTLPGQLGFEVIYYIADCGRKISLNFEPTWNEVSRESGLLEDDRAAKLARDTRKEIARMRKKIKDWAAAVSLSAEKLDQAYVEYDKQLEEALDKYDNRD